MTDIIRMDPVIIDLPEGVVAGRLGFKGMKEIPADFIEVYVEMKGIVLDSADPVALTQNRLIETDNGIRIGDRTISGELALKHLKGSSEITILLATLGAEVDKLIAREEQGGSTLRSFIADGISSELVEFFVRKLDSDIRKGRSGSKGRTRISPGYGDLPLDLNRWIVDELEGESIGVKCMEDSFQLTPRKTVSAFIGWKDEDDRQE